MKKIIEELITKDGIEYKRITTIDERWYIKEGKLYPSSTWIASFYPKGVGFYKWLASKGWDEAEAIKVAAGDKGSKVHYAVTDLLKGKEIKMEDKYISPKTEVEEELKLEEYECLISFSDWFREFNPKILANEIAVFNEKEGYAGTADMVVEIDGVNWLIDIKTGASIWPEYELQISSYRNSDTLQKFGALKTAILQLGYRLNKKKFKFTEVQDKFNLFLSTKEIWKNETEGVVPLQKDYPISLKL